ncbi:Uncharacterised protein [Mycobacteroides abscessus]|nr:Uncharacterised protein [Mycobacteroides abscessus]
MAAPVPNGICLIGPLNPTRSEAHITERTVEGELPADLGWSPVSGDRFHIGWMPHGR